MQWLYIIILIDWALYSQTGRYSLYMESLYRFFGRALFHLHEALWPPIQEFL